MVLFSRKRPYGEARRSRISLVDLRLRSNEARRPFARKPFGRRFFWPWPSLARPLQPAAGMLRCPCGSTSPPRPRPKSLAAAPLLILRQAPKRSRAHSAIRRSLAGRQRYASEDQRSQDFVNLRLRAQLHPQNGRYHSKREAGQHPLISSTFQDQFISGRFSLP